MKMSDRLIIIGAGGHGKVVLDIAIKRNKYTNIIFLDDNFSPESYVMDHEVKDKIDSFENYMDSSEFIIAIGDNTTREKVQNRLEQSNAMIATLIHPSAILAKNVSIGKGTIIMANCAINSDTKIGKGCIINTASSIDHECNIGNYSHISPGSHLAGNVNIGAKTWIGMGVNIINNINICEDCIIGAGSLVLKTVEKSGVYYGIPIKRVG